MVSRNYLCVIKSLVFYKLTAILCLIETHVPDIEEESDSIELYCFCQEEENG